ncbi:uncharacterized protein LOC126907315 isoform X3 [Daktulosphaira vitifoliae]|nr:uncharacterized protein LOC126907315 isoform X3 [Daktulosphaira vitifoliae]XP_050544458.1 uncharacterized protein LOC126907315 isoform X3 [Daktulosphaira vitifoliae]
MREYARNCLCDYHCNEYGDCCTDSPYFDPIQQLKAATEYSCEKINNNNLYYGTFMKSKCPSKWDNQAVRKACEQSVSTDFLIDNPVTANLSGITYRNRYCALCNSDTDKLVIWDSKLVCDDLSIVDGIAESYQQLSNGNWSVKYKNETYNCLLQVEAPFPVRYCNSDMIRKCHPMWPAGEIKSNCEAYTTIVVDRESQIFYKNIHCAMCNHIPVQNLTCSSLLNSRFNIPHSFGSLFLTEPGPKRCWNDEYFYDPFKKSCFPLVPHISQPLNCSKVAIISNVTNGWLPKNGTVDYFLFDNGTLMVCAEDLIGQEEPSESLKSIILTYVGLGVSIVFLVIHLAVFTVLPEMKNLSGKNLASYCVSLIFAYAAFVTGNWLTGAACYVNATITYYLFLTSFAWMLIMSFDCWRTLRLATVELRVSSGRQTKKFLIYSAICWLVPAMVAFVAILSDTIPNVPENLRPRFGSEQCWFGSKTALLVFFAGPLAFIMVINFVLFLWTSYMIHTSRCTSRHITTRHVRRDFRMYCRMTILMGLSWSVGLASYYLNNKYMWILFVVLNAFQGLFVFLAFTCRRRYLNLLVGPSTNNDDNIKKHHKISIRPPPPSFSWSSSGDNSEPISSEKTSSETLY